MHSTLSGARARRSVRASLAIVGLVAMALACGGSSHPAGSGEAVTPGGTVPTDGGGGNTAPSQPPAPCVNTKTDAANCGACGVVCAFEHASASCADGACVRGSCAPGYYDLDGDPRNGCESSCQGAVCSGGGRSYVLSAPPLPESGLVASAFSNSGPLDLAAAPVLADGSPDVRVLGESTPLPEPPLTLDAGTVASVPGSVLQIIHVLGYPAVLRTTL